MFDYNNPIKILIYAGTGSGKSTLIKYFMQKIKFDNLLIISCFENKDYDNYPEEQKMVTIDKDKIEKFTEMDGSKLLILDDILHLGFRSEKDMKPLVEIMSTNRARNLNIIISTQLLSYIGMKFPALVNHYITREFTNDSIEVLKMRTRWPKNELLEIELEPYQFIAADNNGNFNKIKVKITQ